MMLIIQIALGILLGYLLIEHRSRLGRWALKALKLSIFLVLIGIVSTAIGLILNWVSQVVPGQPSWFERILDKFFWIFSAIPIFGILIAGAVGFHTLFRMIFSKWFDIEARPGTLAFFGFVGLLILIPVELFLRSSPYGGWYRAADLWSRQNGYADLIGSLISFSLSLWPWIPILVLRRLGLNYSKEVRGATGKGGMEPDA